MHTNPELDRITGSIKEAALRLFSSNLISVTLYGSYARGDNDDESDIDVFVLVDMSRNAGASAPCKAGIATILLSAI